MRVLSEEKIKVLADRNFDGLLVVDGDRHVADRDQSGAGEQNDTHQCQYNGGKHRHPETDFKHGQKRPLQLNSRE